MADDTIVVAGAESSLNPIACSSCRHKKRKCDRQLPHCLRCSHDPANCHYPEQGKSGIPIGFMNRLETRLDETEDALHRLLQYLDNGTFQNTDSVRPSSRSKADRIKEWDGFPLDSIDDIRKWHEHKLVSSPASVAPRGEIRLPINDSSPKGSINTGPSPSNPILNVSPEASMTASTASLNVGAGISMEGPAEANILTGEGKANNLRNRNPNLYF